METVWDWITVMIFAGLVTLLIQRSQEEVPRDRLWQYAPPAIGCAVANYAGNEGYPLIAVALLAAIAYYVYAVLKVRLPSSNDP
ncbi:MAG: XrtV sorting system accessory protein [Erythrobacter sp.]|jgi:hypothetical protein|nr:XrtV sorting system accessory protein [Erythrobacter sp.]